MSLSSFIPERDGGEYKPPISKEEYDRLYPGGIDIIVENHNLQKPKTVNLVLNRGENMSAVNHPSHYNLPGKKECIEQMKEDYGEGITAIFCLTNAYKYLYRAGHKGSAAEDIDKARWYYDYFLKIQDNVTFDMALNNLAMYIENRLEEIKNDKS